MVTINVSPETKKRFKEKKLKYSAKESDLFSEDEFLNVLLDKFEKGKK